MSHPTSSAPGTGHALVHLKLVGMAALWGASWPAGRVMAQALPPLSASVWRFAIAVSVLALWLRLSGRTQALARLTPRQWLGLAAAGAVGVFGYSVFFMLGLAHVPAGRAALVVTTNPVFTMLLAAWWFGERLDLRIGAGMAMAVLGAVVVITRGAPWTLFSGGVGVGEALLVGCVAAWVGYTLIGRRLLAGVDALVATTVSAGFGLLLLAVAALAIEGPLGLMQPAQAPAHVLWTVVFIALGATVLAYAWYFQGVAVLGAGGAAAYISLVPVFGVASSAVWLGERPDASLMLGGALVVGGMVVMNLARR